MKKILVIPGNTDLNRGDQALVWESVSLVEDIYGKENISCIIMSDLDGLAANMQNRQTAALGYKFVNTLIKHPGRNFSAKLEDSKGYSKRTLFQWGMQALKDYFHTRLLLSKNRTVRRIGESFLSHSEKDTLNEINSCDAVFVKGGGFIHSYGAITDPYFIYYLTYHIRLAEAYGKKIFLLPNSIGPLKNYFARRIALKALRHCALITVREEISKDLLESCKLNPHLFPDLGFFLDPSANEMDEYLSNHGVPLNQKKVVITLRPYRFQGYQNAEKLYNNYISGFVGLVKFLINKGYHVCFMAHTLGPSTHEDDRIAIKEVMKSLPDTLINGVSYIEDYDLNCKEIEKAYSYFDYMVGTRFHSVIFSLNVGVPSIAIAYGGNKSKGIMNVMGSGQFCMDMDKVQENELIDMFCRLESNRNNYVANLKEKRKQINEQRARLVEMVRGFVYE